MACARQVGCSREDDLAGRQHLMLSVRIDSRRQSAERHRVADQRQPLRPFDPRKRLDDGRRQMMSVRDEAGVEVIMRQLLPDVVWMPPYLAMRAVAQMGG